MDWSIFLGEGANGGNLKTTRHCLYDSRTSFIKVAFGRQVAAKKPLVLWDLNPCNPSHSIYKNYIDAYKTQYVGGYQYEHFTIADNLSISKERLEEIESQYVKGSVWYRRDIDGERCIAEGLIYPMYESAMTVVPDAEPLEYCISCDYGTMNAFAALLWGKIGNTWYALREYYYSGREQQAQKTDEQYAKDIEVWCADILPNDRIKFIVDPSAASFIALMQKRNHRFKVIHAANAVSDGIRETANALENGYIKISTRCQNWLMEASGYSWDTDEQEDKPIKINDHLMDAMRYFVKTNHIVRKARRMDERI